MKFLIIAVVLRLLIGAAQAASMTSVTDTLSDSDVAAFSNHTIAFTSVNTVTAGQTIKVQFDPATDAFDLGTLAQADITISGMTLVSTCGGGTDEVTVAIDGTAPDRNATFTVCTGDTVTAGAKTITFGNTKIKNPTSAGSYRITIGGSQTDYGETRVAVIDDVLLSLTLAPSVSFTIEGVAAGQPNANGDSGTTSVATTVTTIPFGTLTPNIPKTAQQKLTVATNAQNGFVVTLQATAFIDGTKDIDFFRDGTQTATPVAWRAPNVSANDENSRGHFGITSEDADLAGDEFGTALFAGNIAVSLASARRVFSHTGPADGATVHQGTTRIGFKIEISPLQEAGSYNTTIEYNVIPTY